MLRGVVAQWLYTTLPEKRVIFLVVHILLCYLSPFTSKMGLQLLNFLGISLIGYKNDKALFDDLCSCISKRVVVRERFCRPVYQNYVHMASQSVMGDFFHVVFYRFCWLNEEKRRTVWKNRIETYKWYTFLLIFMHKHHYKWVGEIEQIRPFLLHYVSLE